MIFISNIKKKFFSGKRAQVVSSFDRSIMHPAREWFIGIFIGIIFTAVGVYWSVTTYSQFINTKIADTGAAKEELVYKGDLVKAAIQDFEARKKVYEELKKNLLGSKVETPLSVLSPETEPVLIEDPSPSVEKEIEKRPENVDSEEITLE